MHINENDELCDFSHMEEENIHPYCCAWGLVNDFMQYDKDSIYYANYGFTVADKAGIVFW